MAAALYSLTLIAVVAAGSPAMAAGSPADCSAFDATLRARRSTVCASLVAPGTPWCEFDNTTTSAKRDWPNQAVYMHDLLHTLSNDSASPSCLPTSTYAADTVRWLDGVMTQTNDSAVVGFMYTWRVFQVQYYDMPRQPGTRIESPDTLGRKCWAFAYLAARWERAALDDALRGAGLNASAFVAAYDGTIPWTMTLCEEVMANCFVNASFDPSRNGTCPASIDRFHYLGFERENAKRSFSIAYPFY